MMVGSRDGTKRMSDEEFLHEGSTLDQSDSFPNDLRVDLSPRPAKRTKLAADHGKLDNKELVQQLSSHTSLIINKTAADNNQAIPHLKSCPETNGQKNEDVISELESEMNESGIYLTASEANSDIEDSSDECTCDFTDEEFETVRPPPVELPENPDDLSDGEVIPFIISICRRKFLYKTLAALVRAGHVKLNDEELRECEAVRHHLARDSSPYDDTLYDIFCNEMVERQEMETRRLKQLGLWGEEDEKEVNGELVHIKSGDDEQSDKLIHFSERNRNEGGSNTKSIVVI